MDSELNDNQKSSQPEGKHFPSTEKSQYAREQREVKLDEPGPSGYSSQESTSIPVIDLCEDFSEKEIIEKAGKVGQIDESVNLFIKLEKQQRQSDMSGKSKPPQTVVLPMSGQNFTPKVDTVYLKSPSIHPLSAELQYFYLELTESIFGFSETKRSESMRSIEKDPNMRELLPNLAAFIKETIEKNIVLEEISFLIYAVKMVKNLLNNEVVPLQEQLHIILPAVISCVVTRKVCKNHTENHWTLRDLSAIVVGDICKKYNSKATNLTKRVIEIYLKPLKDTKNHALTSIYGAVKGLATLGQNTIKNYLLPSIKNISPIIQTAEESFGRYSEDGYKQILKEAKHVRDAVVNATASLLHSLPIVQLTPGVYIDEFGYMGKYMHTEVKNLEVLEDRERKRRLTVYANPLRKSVYNPKTSKPNSPTSDSSDQDTPIFPAPIRPMVIKQYAKRSSISGSYELTSATPSIPKSSDSTVPTSGPNAPTSSTRRKSSYTSTSSTKNVTESHSIVSVAPTKGEMPSPISSESYFSGKSSVQSPFDNNEQTPRTLQTDQFGYEQSYDLGLDKSIQISITQSADIPNKVVTEALPIYTQIGSKVLPDYIVKVPQKIMPGCSIPMINNVEDTETPSDDIDEIVLDPSTIEAIEEIVLNSINTITASPTENSNQLDEQVPPTCSGNKKQITEESSTVPTTQVMDRIEPVTEDVGCQRRVYTDDPVISLFPKQETFYCYRSLSSKFSPTHQMYLNYSNETFNDSLSSLTYNPNEESSINSFPDGDFDEPGPSGEQDNADKNQETEPEPGPSQPKVPPLRLLNRGTVYSTAKKEGKHPSFLSKFLTDPYKKSSNKKKYKENTKKKGNSKKKGNTKKKNTKKKLKTKKKENKKKKFKKSKKAKK